MWQYGGRLSSPRSARVRRSRGARALLLAVMAGLGFTLLRLQVIDVEQYALLARTNRMRPLSVPAPRGTIYDRHGQVVAENVVGYQIGLMPGPRDSMNAQLQRLRPILGLTDADVARARRRWEQERHFPMVVMADAPERAVARLEERRFLFPGVLVNEYPKRHYPAGPVVAQLIGYVSQINAAELARPEFQGYTQGRMIGKQGLEREYEARLSGEPGIRYLEVDAFGRIKRWLPDEVGVPPVPGRDLQLSLDLDLQRYVASIFPNEHPGAFAAIDPQTGGVLALYSTPNYDPNQFIGGIPQSLYDSLTADPRKPLLDRAAGSAQPPASTWKLVVAAMALEEKVIQPDEVMPIPCTGGMWYGGRYAHCWEPAGHGWVDLTKGIMHSCDVYFYQVGIRIGLKRFLELGTRMGFQRRTGLDLPTEVRNIFPTGLEWYEERYGYRPYENLVMSLAIGQAEVTMTPLKMAQFYTAIARPDGRAPAPRLAVSDTAPPITLDLGITEPTAQWLRKGLRRVVGPGGTAAQSRLRDWDFMGKTGTAQACANCSLKSHAWFVGMGGPPGRRPEIVAVAFIQNGEHGYIASGIVADAVNFYLDRKYGKPFEPYPTVRDRLPRGLPIDWKWYSSPVVDPVPIDTSSVANATPPPSTPTPASVDHHQQ